MDGIRFIWLTLLAFFGAAPCLTLEAADLRSVSVVTERTIELYLVDGHIIHYGLRGNWEGSSNTVFYDPLDIAAAEKASRYAITSADDPEFSRAVAGAGQGLR